ncbi:hypothetical protein FGB62_62g231 [Gracilaria domingensis]|nr:hypothetical protein FGB62_62g231 [Gracilaria domingensis]
MKSSSFICFTLVLAVLAAFSSGEELTAHNVRSVADVKLGKKGTCGSDNLKSEAKCSCYHASTKESMPGPLEEVCKDSFGDDLSALKDSCEPYMKNGNLDAGLEASHKKTMNSCEDKLPSDGEGSSRMLVKDTERFFGGGFCLPPWWGWPYGWPWGWLRYRGWWYWWWIIRFHYYWYWRCILFRTLGGFGGLFFGAGSPVA